MIVPTASSRARLSFLLLKIVQGEKTLYVTDNNRDASNLPRNGVFPHWDIHRGDKNYISSIVLNTFVRILPF